MALSLKELHDRLSAIEPTEEIYSGISEEDVPTLEQLLEFEEPWLAARAVYALGRVGGTTAADALGKAARDRRPEVRVAVADSATRVPAKVSDALLAALLADSDAGVRKFALRAVSEDSGQEPLAQVERMAEEDPVPPIRAEARERLEGLRGSRGPGDS
jgi:HEAT repeat protein